MPERDDSDATSDSSLDQFSGSNGADESREGPAQHPKGELVTPDVITPETSADSSSSSRSSPGSFTEDLAEIDEPWTEFFPYGEPYTDQVDGINTLIDTLNNYGYLTMEGACGTGKTLIALVAGLAQLQKGPELINSSDVEEAPRFEQILAVTPIKQQLQQFIDEMRNINTSVPDWQMFDTVVLRGKTDMLPYSSINYPPFDEHPTADKVDDLRENTFELIKFDSSIPLDWPDSIEKPEWSMYEYDWGNPSEDAEEARDQYTYDPYRARAVTEILSDSVSSRNQSLIIDGVRSPYPDEIPTIEMVANMSYIAQHQDDGRKDDLPSGKELEGYIDPFYAGFYRTNTIPVGFADGINNVLDGRTLFELCVQEGICPHESMAYLMRISDVSIGNYYHLFDPQTRLLTEQKGEIINEETICIVDEAHNIEEKVRDMLSEQLGLHTIRTAKMDIRAAIGYYEEDQSNLPATEDLGLSEWELSEANRTITKILRSPLYTSISIDDIREAQGFLNKLETELLKLSRHYLNHDRFDRGWEHIAEQYPSSIRDEEIPLDKSQQDTVDKLTRRMQTEYDFGEDIWEKAALACQAVDQIIDRVDVTDRASSCGVVSNILSRWNSESHTKYFREIKLEAEHKEATLDAEHEWTQEWTPMFHLFNCIPTEQLRKVFSDMGGGVLMSATLEPMDQFQMTTGLDHIPSPSHFPEKEARRQFISVWENDDRDEWDWFEGYVREHEDLEYSPDDDAIEDKIYRPLNSRRYELHFPPANRQSLIVNVPKFTSTNRGDKVTNTEQMTNTRQQYTRLITEIATSPGKTLLCFPSYGEAEWAATLLRGSSALSETAVICDESSSQSKTDEYLQELFSTDNGVICTSNRGTIHEGVDYDGDKLHTCAVFGLSLLPPTPRNKAIQYAYSEELDVDGYETTQKIPATRKARQAIGRVIRGEDERGCRVFVDERYGGKQYGGVNKYLGELERDEFKAIRPRELQPYMDDFWGTDG